MFLTLKKMKPEGQQFGRREWYLIVHDIEINQFFCWCIFTNKKIASNQEPLPMNRKAESGKNRTVLYSETILFSTTGIPLSITIITKLGKTDWYMILISFCLTDPV